MSGRGTHAVGPDFVHGRVALVDKIPLAGARVEAAAAGSCRHPDVISLDADAVHDVVGQAGIELREGVDAAGRNAAQAAHGPGPDVAGILVESEEEHGAMRQSVRWAKTFHLPFS